jgi:hypothetical protein
MEELEFYLFLVVFPARCISSICPRFYFRKHAFCFLLLVAILLSPHLLFSKLDIFLWALESVSSPLRDLEYPVESTDCLNQLSLTIFKALSITSHDSSWQSSYLISGRLQGISGMNLLIILFFYPLPHNQLHNI